MPLGAAAQAVDNYVLSCGEAVGGSRKPHESLWIAPELLAKCEVDTDSLGRRAGSAVARLPFLWADAPAEGAILGDRGYRNTCRSRAIQRYRDMDVRRGAKEGG
jgi:hypothetical protein